MESYGYGSGQRRYGQPRTDEERAARHGSSNLPPRGTGLGIGNLIAMANPLKNVKPHYVIIAGAVAGAIIAYVVMNKLKLK